MDQKYLAEIKAREQAATPGPWEDDIADIWLGDRHIAEVYSTSDTTFIAHARADIPALLAEVERQDQQIATLKKALEIAKRGYVDCTAAEREPDGKCLGCSKSEHDDEPCEQCKQCSVNSAYEAQEQEGKK